jgi:hypothetical protein
MNNNTIRRVSVPNDNSCLFYAIAYLCEGAKPTRNVETKLREIVATQVLSDPDPETKALFLGMSVEEYSQWIRNPFHWGGENEIITLAQFYGVEVAVANCETNSVLVYNQHSKNTTAPEAEVTGRVYILYTGQHYDPLVGDTTPEETKRFPISSSNTTNTQEAEADALRIAAEHNVEAARKAKQRRVKRIKCGGCDAVLGA